ncbi:NUDIX domain-containing protein [Candidatus Saccharibacteria bacterium]|nr:NUDIX domain-containing protein [Candidatus Saccharibacteria bacterium]
MKQKTELTADAHIAQMKILRALLLAKQCSFADLTRAAGLSSDYANFHLKQLIAVDYVEHVPKTYGRYRLTRTGKQYANSMDTDVCEIEKQPKLTVDLAIERDDGKFIVQERQKQPYYGYHGFPTGKIRWGETMLEAGARELLEETGLTADLRVVDIYHKLDYDTQGLLLEDKYMCLIHGINPMGELIVQTESYKNEWMSIDEYNALDTQMGDINETVAMLRKKLAIVRESKVVFDGDAF